eukprot:GHVN01007983.1.p1 GENE.GHVN01007983.1~~GHVN01007983.1.p1  ORF type:complete len:743 (+),score=168.51 GHVN01007983.1:89-2317(+)
MEEPTSSSLPRISSTQPSTHSSNGRLSIDSSSDSDAFINAFGERRQLKIAFFHLDLGLGGAEQLIVSAANGLQQRGHEVTIYTAYHDPQRAFPQTVDGTLHIVTYEFGPRVLWGRFHILLSIIRMLWVWFRVLIQPSERFDCVVNDQVSAINPLLRFLTNRSRDSKVVFYCHFPDLRLATDRSTWLRRLYRVPFDWVERCTTSPIFCDSILVNSHFTKQVVEDTFDPTGSESLGAVLRVIYPPIDIPPVQHRLNRFQERGFDNASSIIPKLTPLSEEGEKRGDDSLKENTGTDVKENTGTGVKENTAADVKENTGTDVIRRDSDLIKERLSRTLSRVKEGTEETMEATIQVAQFTDRTASNHFIPLTQPGEMRDTPKSSKAALPAPSNSVDTHLASPDLRCVQSLNLGFVSQPNITTLPPDDQALLKRLDMEISLSLAVPPLSVSTKAKMGLTRSLSCFVNSKQSDSSSSSAEKGSELTAASIFWRCVRLPAYGGDQDSNKNIQNHTGTKSDGATPTMCQSPFFVSLNRYERKKNIELCLRAFKEFLKMGAEDDDPRVGLLAKESRFVIAGGYDCRLSENKAYLTELQQLAFEHLRLSNHQVFFLCTIPDNLRWALLHQASAVVYSPSEEHFGIVPCEAMGLGTPVIACCSGGPIESVVTRGTADQTGWLCDPTPVAFGRAMMERTRLSLNANGLTSLAEVKANCVRRVDDLFSLSAFCNGLESVFFDKKYPIGEQESKKDN